LLELARITDTREALAEFRAERVVDVEPLLLRSSSEQRVVQSVDAPKLFERAGVIVDT
jgi:hypothetical protein